MFVSTHKYSLPLHPHLLLPPPPLCPLRPYIGHHETQKYSKVFISTHKYSLSLHTLLISLVPPFVTIYSAQYSQFCRSGHHYSDAYHASGHHHEYEHHSGMEIFSLSYISYCWKCIRFYISHFKVYDVMF